MINTITIKGITIGEGTPKICVPLVGRTEEEILAQADDILNEAGKSNIKVVEFRGDYYNNLNDFSALGNLLKKLNDRFENIILLFTIRSQKEGGEELAFSTPSISDINTFVIENHLADMVDVELFSDYDTVSILQKAKEHGIKVIMSSHDFKTTPPKEEIIDRLKKMQEMGADIAKIAVMPENKLQVADLIVATCMMKKQYATVPIVTISMGSLGAISRICGEVFGSHMTFATVGKASAPGQIPASELNNIMSDIKKYCE